MRSLSYCSSLRPILTVLLLLLGVSSAVSAHHAVPRGSQSAALLFVGVDGQDRTEIVNSEYKTIGIIPTFGISATDTNANLYVVPIVGGYLTSKLQIFAPPYTHSPTEIDFGNYDAADIAINTRTRLFAVTAVFAGGGPGPSYVQFYQHGITPCNRVPISADLGVSGTAFDRSGTLFLGLSLSNGRAIGSIVGECDAKSLVINTLPSAGITPLRPLTFNTSNQLVFQDQRTYNVLTFAHPKNGRFGAPIATTKLQGYYPQLVCISSDGKHLWAWDYGKHFISEFLYPQGGAPIVRFHSPHPDGCAVSPPVMP